MDSAACRNLLELYFDQHDKRQIVYHQISSFNHFMNVEVPQTILRSCPVRVTGSPDLNLTGTTRAAAGTAGTAIRVSIEGAEETATTKPGGPLLQAAAAEPGAPPPREVEVCIEFANVQIRKPTIFENNGAVTPMYPNDARLRNMTYAAPIYTDIIATYTLKQPSLSQGGEPTVTVSRRTLPHVQVGRIPVMVGSNFCLLSDTPEKTPREVGECSEDIGGYFIVQGGERVIISQERMSENVPFVFRNNKVRNKEVEVIDVKSIGPDNEGAPKSMSVKILHHAKNAVAPEHIVVTCPRIKAEIPLFVMMRALGLQSDREIIELICGQASVTSMVESTDATASVTSMVESTDATASVTSDPTASGSKGATASMVSKESPYTMILQECMEEAAGITTQEKAHEWLAANLGSGGGSRESYSANTLQPNKPPRTSTIREVLAEECLPHIGGSSMMFEKACYIAFITKKVLDVFLGKVPHDDRDAYPNKKVELPGNLMGNLFRYLFGTKVIKDMKTSLTKEIHNGFWKSSGKVEDIINPSNIYKILKSTIVTIGMKSSLATGNFVGGKMGTKIGISQVMNRLTYLSGISHLRRLSTPIEKTGKLLAPRKLHNTQYGFVCPAETPEGHAVGVVKNLSSTALVSLPISPEPIVAFLYDVLAMKNLGDVPRALLFEGTRILINGAWIGILDTDAAGANAAAAALRGAKRSGRIHPHTGITYKTARREIWINTEGGRLIRPVLNAAAVRELAANPTCAPAFLSGSGSGSGTNWNAVLQWVSPQGHSLIEYIDPTETENFYIAMHAADVEKDHTHTEIHPCTMLGTMASNIPFPDHNQAPRNSYQCLHVDETVRMADGTEKRIADVCVGDLVQVFDPATLEMTTSHVINQYVRATEKHIFTVKASGGRSITATEDHLFMTNLGWIQTRDLLPETHLLAVSTDPSLSSDEVILSEYTREFGEVVPKQFVQWHRTVYTKGAAVFVPIKSVTEVPTCMISDITVASDHHTFVTSHGIMCHNSAMGKQAMGVYALNFRERLDTMSNLLWYSSVPLASPYMSRFYRAQSMPSGFNIVVAIMTYGGYNQEDSIMINRSALDRGLFRSEFYRTYKDEEKKNQASGEEERFCRPNPATTRHMKLANYAKLGPEGIVPENTYVNQDDVLIGKVAPIRLRGADGAAMAGINHAALQAMSSVAAAQAVEAAGGKRFRDSSKLMRTNESGYVDRIYRSRNGEGYSFVKIRVREERIPVIGDKFSSRHGQKGTCGLILAPEDMPQTASGIVPDIIINPHCFVGETQVALPNGLSRRIDSFSPEGLEKVLSWDPENKQVYESYSLGRTDRGVKPTIRLTLEDGRTIRCTRDHKFIVRELDGSMVHKEAGDLTFRDSLVMSVQGTEDVVCPLEPAWSLTCGDYVFETQTASGREKAMAFARLLGSSLFVNNHYDIQSVVADIVAVTDSTPNVERCATDWSTYTYRIYIPENLELAMEENLARTSNGHPSFLFDIKCPTSIVREYLAAYTWKDNICVHDTTFSHIEYEESRCEEDALDFQETEWMESRIIQFTYLLKRVGIETRIFRTRLFVCDPDDIRLLSIRAVVTSSHTEFHNKIGVRHCVRRQMQLEIAAAYDGTYEKPLNVHDWLHAHGCADWFTESQTINDTLPTYTMGLMRSEVSHDAPVYDIGISRTHYFISQGCAVSNCIPSRMTIAQLMETLLGRLGCELGFLGDATPFNKAMTAAGLAHELQERGLEPYSNEVLYCGYTGKQMPTNIFMGPCFYQRLKHMVNDKIHSRSTGPLVMLTRQPAEGRARDGGLRFGEMERDVMIAHGASAFLKERMMEASDNFEVHVCKGCGLIGVANKARNIWNCTGCGNTTDFSQVRIPYAYKLFLQELESMNISSRILPETRLRALTDGTRMA